jgi:cytochrome c oxidase subunit 3
MAWAVRSAQLGQQQQLIFMLNATLVCASFFLGVKAVEYGHKWNEGLLWAGAYSAGEYGVVHDATGNRTALLVLSIPATIASVIALGGLTWARFVAAKSSTQRLCGMILVACVTFFLGVGAAHEVQQRAADDRAHTASALDETTSNLEVSKPADTAALTGVFFSIYYVMTGVHAIHILAGMGVIAWLLSRAIRGDFGANYFAPVDYVGLYWHLVDLVWIYLFPLLYLIR